MNYYRKISALLPNDLKKRAKGILNKKVFRHLVQFLFLALLCQVFLFIAVIFMLRSEYRHRINEFAIREKEHVYWVQVAEQYPNAPDVLYNAALTAKNIGNIKDAIYYLDRAVKLDPLFMEARLLKESLTK